MVILITLYTPFEQPPAENNHTFYVLYVLQTYTTPTVDAMWWRTSNVCDGLSLRKRETFRARKRRFSSLIETQIIKPHQASHKCWSEQYYNLVCPNIVGRQFNGSTVRQFNGSTVVCSRRCGSSQYPLDNVRINMRNLCMSVHRAMSAQRRVSLQPQPRLHTTTALLSVSWWCADNAPSSLPEQILITTAASDSERIARKKYMGSCTVESLEAGLWCTLLWHAERARSALSASLLAYYSMSSNATLLFSYSYDDTKRVYFLVPFFQLATPREIHENIIATDNSSYGSAAVLIASNVLMSAYSVRNRGTECTALAPAGRTAHYGHDKFREKRPIPHLPERRYVTQLDRTIYHP